MSSGADGAWEWGLTIPRVTARDGGGTQWVGKVHPRITSLIRALPKNQPRFPAAGIYLSFQHLCTSGGKKEIKKGREQLKNPPTNTSAAAEELKNTNPAWKKGSLCPCLTNNSLHGQPSEDLSLLLLQTCPCVQLWTWKIWPCECPARTGLHILLLFLCFPPLELLPLCFYSATLLLISSF